jgi:hypothetical protein
VISNNGCLEALDPLDGDPIWARSYEHQGNEHGSRQPWNRPPEEFPLAAGFGYNPVLPLEDAGVVCPEDSDQMLLVRLSTGELMAQKSRKTPTDGCYRYVLGNWGGRVVLEGDGAITTFDLVEDGRGRLDLDRAWENKVTRNPGESGRGILAGHRAYVPHGKRGIVSFDVAEDDVRDTGAEVVLPWKRAAHEAGDLVWSDGHFLSVAARWAHVYATKTKRAPEGTDK